MTTQTTSKNTPNKNVQPEGPASSADWNHRVQSVFSSSWQALDGASLPARPPHYREISVTPDELIPLIGALDRELLRREDVLPVCLSDFDGTLTSGTSGSRIFEYGVSSGFFLEAVRPQILETLKFFSLEPNPENSVGQEFLRILGAFRSWSQDKGLSADLKEEGTRRAYKMLSWIYAGHTREEVHAFAVRAFEAIGYNNLYLSGARELVDELTQLGIRTAIVSVKFQPILEVAARYFNLPESAVIGMNLQVDGEGRFTTEIREPMTFREGKDIAARSWLEQHAVGKAPNARPLLAMGDSPAKSDLHMLKMAHIALYAEPQTDADAEYARGQIGAGQRAVIVDYKSTQGGDPVALFDRDLEAQVGPQGRFL